MDKPRQIFLHIIVWVALIIIFLFMTNGRNGGIRHKDIVIFVYYGVINVSIFYTNYLFILPRFLPSKRYWLLAAGIIGMILIMGLVKYGVAASFEDYILVRNRGRETVGFLQYYIGTIFVSTFFVFLSTAFWFGIDWFLNEKLRKNLENEKLTAELAFLKSQINPHFLLNSLNNIYSLAYQRAEKTPEAILKLSEIMRYMLYESNDAKVELNKEVRYLENYIELQKIRYKDSAFVNFEMACDGHDKTIVPLILIPFVENAFKHGVITDPENPVAIRISIQSDCLLFRVSNKKNLQNKDETGGIGFHNVKRRLDLLYPGKYSLQIDNSPLYYTCELSLDL